MQTSVIVAPSTIQMPTLCTVGSVDRPLVPQDTEMVYTDSVVPQEDFLTPNPLSKVLQTLSHVPS